MLALQPITRCIQILKTQGENAHYQEDLRLSANPL